MPLPEKEYFTLEEIETRWRMSRADTLYYAENSFIRIATRVFRAVVETGLIETDEDGRWYTLPEEHERYSGLLTLHAFDLATVLRRGSASICFFDPGENRYGDIVEPKGGIEVRTCDLVVTRAERDRFEQAHALGEHVQLNGSRAAPVMLPIDCSDDGGWIKVHGRAYQFSGLLQKTAVRRLYEAWENGTPKLNMQALLEDIESGSRHISQVFGTGNRSWREIVGYSRGYVWLKVDG